MRQLFLLLFLSSSLVFGQSLLDQKISVKFSNFSVERALRLIEKKTSNSFSYNSKQLKQLDKRVDGDYKDTDLSRILDDIFQSTPFKFKEIGQQITIYELSASEGNVVISGYIRDKDSKEELAGSRIYFPEHKIGCLANSYGYYSLEIPKGKTSFIVSSVGMLKIKDTLDAQENRVMNFSLDEDTLLLNVVEVHADSLQVEKLESDLPYLEKTMISKREMTKVPAVNGELDLMKYLMQFPGVAPSTEGGATYQIRGSGTGNNLILLDEIPIYHPTHLLGLYSIVNVDALKSATLYKDYIPARFGTRNSSVLQIHTKEGNLNKHHLSGSLGLISARVNWEGPIVKNKASFYLSGRRSTFPAIAGRFLTDQNLTLPSFYDLNAKVNYHVNSNNRIYLTGYYGKDHLSDTVSTYDWGNAAAAFRWNHIFNSKTFSNLSLTHSEFQYGFVVNSGLFFDNFKQKVVTDKLNYDVTNFFSSSLKIKYGLSLAWLRTRNGNASTSASTLFLQRNAFENAAYVSVEKKLSEKWKLDAGIRVPFSFHVGTQDTTYYLDPDLNLTEVVYDENKFYDFLYYIDPRLLLSTKLNAHNQLQLAAGITSQHTHIVNYVNYFLPVEIWTTSNAYLKPERNFQLSMAWIYSKRSINTSLTVFGKHVRNILDYASPIFTSSADIESNLLSGTLNAYGAELMVNYKLSTRYSLAVSYTYTVTSQKIPGVNGGLAYPSVNDRPHYLSINQFFNISKKWKVSASFTYHSGKAITLPNGQFVIDGTAFPVFDDNRNAERLRFFSRWDASVTRQFGVKRRKDKFSLALNITNFYGRFNPAVVYVEPDNTDPNKLRLVSRDYTPFMIYLNFNFKL